MPSGMAQIYAPRVGCQGAGAYIGVFPARGLPFSQRETASDVAAVFFGANSPSDLRTLGSPRDMGIHTRGPPIAPLQGIGGLDPLRLATRYDKLARNYFSACASLPPWHSGFNQLSLDPSTPKSRERVRAEFMKLLAAGRASEVVQTMGECGFLEPILGRSRLRLRRRPSRAGHGGSDWRDRVPWPTAITRRLISVTVAEISEAVGWRAGVRSD